LRQAQGSAGERTYSDSVGGLTVKLGTVGGNY